jgi:L-lactate dehydrogenase (cytochrome)
MSRWIPDRSFELAPGSVGDFRELARRRLPRQLFDYIDGGSYDESTMAANVADLSSVLLRQRILRDVSDLDLEQTVLGRKLAMPVILGPVGLAGMYSRRAEVSAARAAEKAGVVFCESTVSICSLEEVAAATTKPIWYQLYIMRDRSVAADLIARAASAKCSVLVLTVDLPVVGARYRDIRNGLVGSQNLVAKALRYADYALHPGWAFDVGLKGKPHTFGNLEHVVPNASSPHEFKAWVDSQFDSSVTWDDLAWVRDQWPGKLILKGILDSEDAKTAARVGVDGIVVSNHGGRQLDSTPSTASVLGPIVDSVGDQLEVLVDGGVRSGLDVVKMVALGAKACLVGRAWAWAVASGGEPSVEHALRIIRNEIKVALSLTGAARIDKLDRSALA